MPGRQYNSNQYRFGYQGSEKDDEITNTTGANITTLFRENDTRICHWWSIDPETSETHWESPYVSMGGNPILNNDPLGDSTNFYNKEGKLIKHIDDNSNAKFQLTGDSWSNQYFKFAGYDESQGGNNEVNLQSVIDFTQDYTRDNYTSSFKGYKKDDKGNIIIKDGKPIEIWHTHCNQGTFCITKSVNSALEEMGSKLNMNIFEGNWGTLRAGDIYNN